MLDAMQIECDEYVARRVCYTDNTHNAPVLPRSRLASIAFVMFLVCETRGIELEDMQA